MILGDDDNSATFRREYEKGRDEALREHGLPLDYDWFGPLCRGRRPRSRYPLNPARGEVRAARAARLAHK